MNFSSGDGQYDQSLDVFTFGLTLNELFTEKIHRFIQSTKRVQLIEQSPIFRDRILQCIQDEPTGRPTAAEMEDTLHKYRRAADRYITEKCPNYSDQTIALKDAAFIRFYQEYHLQEQAEPKVVFPPPPKGRQSLDLMRQHFEDMMRQLNSIDQKDPEQVKDHPRLVKLTKHFDRPNPIVIAEPIRRDRRARTPPPPNLHREHRENNQQFLQVVKERRSPSPNLMSPRFHDPLRDRDFPPLPDRFRALGADNDIDQRMQRLRFAVDFDRNMRKFK